MDKDILAFGLKPTHNRRTRVLVQIAGGLLICGSILAACQAGEADGVVVTPTTTPHVETVTGGDATQNATPTSTVTPTPLPHILVVALDVPLDSVVAFDAGLNAMPSGTYLLYEGDLWYRELDYTLLDGSRHGTVLRFNEPQDIIQVSNNSADPFLLAVDFENGELILHRISITERTIQSFVVSLADENASLECTSDYHCSFSPDGNWFLGTSNRGNRSTPYLVDLTRLHGVELDTSAFSCNPRGGFSGWGASWSPDSSWFYVSCPSDYSSTQQSLRCFGSLDETGIVCRSPYVVYAISSNYVAAGIRVLDGETGRVQDLMAITERECLLTGGECEYWHQQALDGTLTAEWDRTGRYLVWFDYPVIGEPSGFRSGYTTIGIVDAQTGEERILTEWGPIGGVLVTLSPDNQWAVFSGRDSILTISLETLVIRSYPFLYYSPFYQWWVIP